MAQPAWGTPSAQTLPPDSISRMATHLQLADKERQSLHAFNKLDDSRKLLELYASMLKSRQDSTQILEGLKGIQKRQDDLERLVGKRWELTNNHKEALKVLVAHYVASPQPSYNDLLSSLEKYIIKHAAALTLEQYVDNKVVRTAVNGYLGTEINNKKNQYRKLIFTSVLNKVALNRIAEEIIKNWHTKPKPQVLSDKWLAQIALEREIAVPIAHIKSAKGGDTGFWRTVNARVKKLHEQNGTSRKDARWIEWQTGIISADREKFPDIGAVYIDSDSEEEASEPAAGTGGDDIDEEGA
ncbi:hypothetical protein OH76DRAFT_1487928 [Lentinus brumalis]|uniref:Uncharacterized protein n=1 Tax=Lentinus brumalis TaxID=2498619 RepID=A0A371CST5_9APHY|nr:hypothetical protein OH76DRAFT_1487928 [Polyporus brumalis]